MGGGGGPAGRDGTRIGGSKAKSQSHPWLDGRAARTRLSGLKSRRFTNWAGPGVGGSGRRVPVATSQRAIVWAGFSVSQEGGAGAGPNGAPARTVAASVRPSGENHRLEA